jgi:C4-dicarboxylate-specific signal transduction histidine kinase
MQLTGRRAPLPYAATFALARRLQPDAKRVVIVAGAGARDSLAVSYALHDVEPLTSGMELVVLQGSSYQTLLEKLYRLPPETIVLLANFRLDRAGQAFITAEAVPSIARASSAPVYGVLGSWIGKGLVGGAVIQFAEEGVRTGYLVDRVLRRQPGEPMPPSEIAVSHLTADWRWLRRWRLPEHRLPPGTEVLFRTATVWERYRGLILMGIGLIAAQSLLIGLLLVERRRRKKGAQVIRQGEELNRAVLASISTQIAILDRTGTIIRVNQAWSELARSADSDAFLGKSYLDECRRAEARGCREAVDVRLGIESVLTQRTSPFRYEYHWSSPEERWYELSVDSLQHAEGGAVVSHMDITDRRLAELKVEETRSQLAHLGRVAIVGELGAAITHELHQPLAAIRANAQAGVLLLEKTRADGSQVQEIFRDIMNDDARAVDVIHHIRTLLRKEAPGHIAVDLNEICRQATHLLHRDAILRRVSLNVSLDPDVPRVVGDPVQLQQVVINLTLNALDASAGSANHAVTITTATHKEEAEISIRDTGPGLAPEVQQHLFEAFFSTKAQGLGMGLVIVRSIVERHNGRVHAESLTNGGAIFRVLLPVQ